jgi:hypothetical protein
MADRVRGDLRSKGIKEFGMDVLRGEEISDARVHEHFFGRGTSGKYTG